MGQKETERRRWLKKQYDLTPNEYTRMLINQNRCCAICFKEPDPKRRLAVDHNHSTGLVRGLLCTKCNMALGFLNDDLETAESAVAYLYQHRKKLWEMP